MVDTVEDVVPVAGRERGPSADAGRWSRLACNAILIVTGWGLLTILGCGSALALAAIAVAWSAVALASRLKLRYLGEPLLIGDLAMAWQVFRYPALYLGAVGLPRVAGLAILALLFLLVSGAGLALGVAGLNALRMRDPLHVAGSAALLLGLLASCGLLLREAVARLARAGAGRGDGGFAALREALGPVPLFLAPLVAPDNRAAIASPPVPRGHPATANLPHLVLVQAESFIDPRRLGLTLPHDPLPAFRRLECEAEQRGGLRVPHWRGITYRTEFAVLTGRHPLRLGIAGRGGYQQLVPAETDSLAWRLRALGYGCQAIHGFDARFFGRDKVLPRLGFQALRFGAAGSGSDAGATGDEMLLPAIGEALARADEPQLLFVITFGSHASWKQDPADPQMIAAMPPGLSIPCRAELARYLTTLETFDGFLGCLRAQLAASERPVVLGLYGDHAPLLPQLWDKLGVEEIRTPYLLWSSSPGVFRRRAETALDAEDLGDLLFERALNDRSPTAVPGAA